MLVDTSKNFPADGDVVALKMSNGEEAIGKVVSQSDESYRLSRPLSLAMTSQGPMLRPFMMTVDFDHFEVSIPKAHVVGIAKPRDEIEKEYIQNTSGIQLATAGSI